MAANPRLVANDTWVPWDHVMTHVAAGTVVDIPPGSDLEEAYGGDANLVALGTGVSYVVAEPEQPTMPPPDEPPPDEPPPDTPPPGNGGT
jgi:hypothetical protein